MYRAKLIQSPPADKPVEVFKENTISFTAKTKEDLIALLDRMTGKFRIYKLGRNQNYELIEVRTARGISHNV